VAVAVAVAAAVVAVAALRTIPSSSVACRQTARKAVALGPNEIAIDNFQFSPPTLTVKAGTKITWINNDDVPHLIVNVQNKFKQSPVLDTDQKFSATLAKPGTYNYFCSLHPKMQGTIVVKT
jgi:plastocyanin